MIYLFLILFIKIDLSPKVVDTFDIIEVNHTYNKWGGKGLVQVMAIDWVKDDRSFHCQWYKVLRNAFVKTEEGEKRWLKNRRNLADMIKDWPTRQDFLINTPYQGEFNEMHELYPVKNWKTGYWEVKFSNRIIRSKSFTETHTYYDSEVKDRKNWPVSKRKGLTKTKEELVKELKGENFEHQLPDFIAPILKNMR